MPAGMPYYRGGARGFTSAVILGYVVNVIEASDSAIFYLTQAAFSDMLVLLVKSLSKEDIKMNMNPYQKKSPPRIF